MTEPDQETVELLDKRLREAGLPFSGAFWRPSKHSEFCELYSNETPTREQIKAAYDIANEVLSPDAQLARTRQAAKRQIDEVAVRRIMRQLASQQLANDAKRAAAISRIDAARTKEEIEQAVKEVSE